MSVLLLCICLGPSTQSVDNDESVSDIVAVFAVDNSGSMSALDDPQDGTTRLDKVRADVESLVNYLPPSEYTGIVFNSVSNISLPLTRDVDSTINWARSITPEITKYSKGTDLVSLVSVLNDAVVHIKDVKPNSRIFLYYFSDGDVPSGEKIGGYSVLRQEIDGGEVFGYGSTTPARMLSYSPDMTAIDNLMSSADSGPRKSISSNTVDFIKDPSTGQDATSTLNEPLLTSVAQNLNLKYETRTSNEPVIKSAKSVYANSWIYNQSFQTKTYTNLIIWPFVMGFGILVLIELFFFISLGSLKEVINV
jgi:Ca-activated chloride channel family protein